MLSRETAEFILKQSRLIRDLCEQNIRQQQILFKINEYITIVQKSILLNGNEQFHDFVTQFYQEKINQLNKELQKKNYFKNKQELISLKKQLVKAKQINNQNIKVINQKNNAIQTLQKNIYQCQNYINQNKYIAEGKIQEYQQKIYDFESEVKSRKLIWQQQFKESLAQRNKMSKEIRQLQISNTQLHQQRQSFKNISLVKEQQCKILLKKNDEQKTIINNLQKIYELKQNQLNQCAKFLKQQTNKFASLNEKYFLLDEKQRVLQKQYAVLKALKNEYKQKIPSNSESLLQKAVLQKDTLLRELNRQRQQVLQLQQLLNRQNNRSKQTQNLYQDIRGQARKITLNFQKQKQQIKEDIEVELKELQFINQQLILKGQSLQQQVEYMNNQKMQLINKNHRLCDAMQTLTAAYESTKKTVDKLQQLEFQHNQNDKKHSKSIKRIQQECKQLQQKLQQAKEQTLCSKEKIQQLKKQNTELLEINKQVKQTTKINNKTEEIKKFEMKIKQLKEEICRINFLNKQLQSKVNVLQEELKEIENQKKNDKQQMLSKIKDLEEIIKERFSISSRMNESYKSQEQQN